MLAVEFQQAGRVRLSSRQVRDAIHGLARGLSFARHTVSPCAVAGHSKDLPHAGPAERALQIEVQRRRAGQRPLFLTAVLLGVGRCGLSLGLAFTLNVGGGKAAFAAVNSLEIAATHCGGLFFTGST